ncbi:MAG: hypothetical protein ABIF77_16385 [bacterium]
MRRIANILLVLGAISFCSLSQAQDSRVLPFQAVITKADGDTIAANTEVTFLIYAEEFPGESARWTGTLTVSPGANSVVSVLLGTGVEENHVFPPGLFDGSDRYLAIMVDGDELSPRIHIGWTAYAFNADRVGGLTSDDFAPSDHDHDALYFTQSVLSDSLPGSVNQSDNPVHWSNLRGVPPEIADGQDAVGGSGDGNSLDSEDGNHVDVVKVYNSGNVGIEMESPDELLDVGGNIQASGQLISTTTGSAPLAVSSSEIVAGFNADQLDSLHASDFAQSSHSHDEHYYTKDQLHDPGTINLPANPVDWSKLVNVPEGFEDGVDNEGGAGSGHSLDAADGSPPEVVYVNDDGQVGINTTSPEELLDVNGDVRIRSPGALYVGTDNRNTDDIIYFDSVGTNEEFMHWDHYQFRFEFSNALALSGAINTGDNTLSANYNRMGTVDTEFELNDSEDLLISDDLEVHGEIFIDHPGEDRGISIRSSTVYGHIVNPSLEPLSLNLHRGTQFDISPIMIAPPDFSTTESGGFFVDGDYAVIWSPADEGRMIRFVDSNQWDDADSDPYNNDSEVAYIDAVGGYHSLSNPAVLKNVATIIDANTKVGKLRGVAYDFPASKETPRTLGLLADEVENIVPEAVQTDGNGQKFINYSALIPLLIEAIKEQGNMIEELRTEVEALR